MTIWGFMRSAETFQQKNMRFTASIPITKITYMLSFPPPSSEQFLSAVWGAGLQSSFAQNKTQLSSLTLRLFFNQPILAPIVMFLSPSGGKFKYQVPGVGNFWGGFFLCLLPPFPSHYTLPTLHFAVPKGGNKDVTDFNCRSCPAEAVSRSEMDKLAA